MLLVDAPSYFTASVKGMFTRCSLRNHVWSSLVRSTWLTSRSLVPSSPSSIARRATTLMRFGFWMLLYLRFIVQPINAPAVTPTANVVAAVNRGCRWMR